MFDYDNEMMIRKSGNQQKSSTIFVDYRLPGLNWILHASEPV